MGPATSRLGAWRGASSGDSEWCDILYLCGTCLVACYDTVRMR